MQSANPIKAHNLKNLLVFNFRMDLDNQVLSHQVEAVNALAKHFRNVTVITGAIGRVAVDENVTVMSSEWRENQPIRNAIGFFRLAIPAILKTDCVFSHMTDVQSSMVGLFTRLLSRRHFLWYAHTHKSVYLRVAHFFIDGVVTSTMGSCPLTGAKIYPIGQAINLESFNFRKVSLTTPRNFTHVGRLDPLKNIEILIEATRKAISDGNDLKLEFVGAPSSGNLEYVAKLKLDSTDFIKLGWLNFRGPLTRIEIPEYLASKDAFMHAYMGSLDKAILEATSIGIPVVTINPEYLKEFGTWGKCDLNSVSLESELRALLLTKISEINSECERRSDIVSSQHSLKAWAAAISRLLSK